MSGVIDALSEKERATLRLLLRGHDAKSSARALGLSVHTVNERLRDARRKLGVTSSREAARLLLEAEGTDPETLGYTGMGEAGSNAHRPGTGHSSGRHGDGRPARPQLARWIGGVLAMSAFLALLLLATPVGDSLAGGSPSAAAPAKDAAVEAAAREWLALVDAGDWKASYAATGSAFRKLNTQAMWEKAAIARRVPFGAVAAREAASFADLNAPPHGYKEAVFKTRFTNGREATETVTLEWEGGAWRVVGCTIE